MYDDFHDQVYAYAVSRAGRPLADDVTSETFLVAWRRRDDVPDAPLPWLLTVARNVLRDQFRATVRRDSLAAEMRIWAETASGDVADEVTERAAVLRALAALGDADREVLTLAAWHGLTSAEAARVLGCSRAAYFVRLHRARRRLDAALAAAEEPPAVPVLVPVEEGR
ncbi:RNA polymerase sigma factor [Bailinhaonella thermotolerans]|uniref:RNA polymerase sigma factor n=1 Tax=Bailinhaonella thermotolerans TaxID=1070861 RepID=A0A3A4APP9_9ACTN|nr:RNA polymerase sigma factor [Bailinhaonella thermotolerans]